VYVWSIMQFDEESESIQSSGSHRMRRLTVMDVFEAKNERNLIRFSKRRLYGQDHLMF
jgi:hypothetical protein